MGVTGWWAEVHAAVAVPAVQATATAIAPIVAVDTLVVAPSVEVTAQMLAPTIGISYKVDVPVMATTAGMRAPAVGYGVGVAVGPMSVTAQMIAPAVIVDSAVAVPTMSASAAMAAPSAALSVDFDVLPAAMVSTAVMLPPSVSVDSNVIAPTMTASAEMAAPSAVVSAVNWDATGGGATVSGVNTLTWSHTATGANRCVLIGVTYGAFAAITASATYGGVAMTSLGRRNFNNAGANWTELFVLVNPATGSQPVVVNLSVNTLTASGNSVSYTGVGSVGTPVLAHGSSTTPAVSVPSGANRRVVAVLASAAGKSAFNQTERYNAGAVSASALIGDAAGAATVAFSATQATGPWSAIGVDLIPA